MRFDVPAQPAASALNAFAMQADIALIFSYDLVAGVRTPALRGRYTVDAGLARLLRGTGLAHRRAGAGAYLVCAPAECAADRGSADR
ncbi:STN domain-containing protein [Luteimonas sp. Y-2-2-4F]|nr:STN domain-containing protein [Luteimonas sp. Y-2-2-4F]MCD9032118.1 STN domain-containing protein [Luteimonas sp. Y-2-2-4F]